MSQKVKLIDAVYEGSRSSDDTGRCIQIMNDHLRRTLEPIVHGLHAHSERCSAEIEEIKGVYTNPTLSTSLIDAIGHTGPRNRTAIKPLIHQALHPITIRLIEKGFPNAALALRVLYAYE